MSKKKQKKKLLLVVAQTGKKILLVQDLSREQILKKLPLRKAAPLTIGFRKWSNYLAKWETTDATWRRPRNLCMRSSASNLA